MKISKQTYRLLSYGTIVLLSFIALIIIYFSPSEKTLGAYVKLIYFHAAFYWANLAIFASSAMLSMFSKVRDFSRRLYLVGASGWVVNVALSALSMKIIWGAVVFEEPRFRHAVAVLFIIIIAVALAYFFKNKNIRSALFSASVIAVFVFTFMATNVIHPAGAISGSSSLAIRMMPWLVAFCIFIIGLLIGGLVTSWQKERR